MLGHHDRSGRPGALERARVDVGDQAAAEPGTQGDGLPLSSIWRVSVANCSLSAVSPPRVLSVNDVSHLAGIEVGTGAPSLDP